MRLFNVLLLETIRACTRACPFCAYGQERPFREPGQRMEMALLERIAANLQELRYRGRVSLHSINEPLKDDRIVAIVELFRRSCPGAFISLISNGDLLTENIYHGLEAAGLDRLGISLYDDESLARLKAFTSLPRVRVIDMRQPQDKLENRGLSIQDREHRFGLAGSGTIFLPCWRPFRMMVIQGDGRAVLCCADLYGDMAMGDASRQRLEDIWWGAPFSQVRARLRHGRSGLLLCHACTHKGHASPLFYPRCRCLADGLGMAKKAASDILDRVGCLTRRLL